MSQSHMSQSHIISKKTCPHIDISVKFFYLEIWRYQIFFVSLWYQSSSTIHVCEDMKNHPNKHPCEGIAYSKLKRTTKGK